MIHGVCSTTRSIKASAISTTIVLNKTTQIIVWPGVAIELEMHNESKHWWDCYSHVWEDEYSTLPPKLVLLTLLLGVTIKWDKNS